MSPRPRWAGRAPWAPPRSKTTVRSRSCIRSTTTPPADDDGGQACAHPPSHIARVLESEQRVGVGVRGVDDDAVDRLLLILTRLTVGDEGVRLLDGELRDQHGGLQARREK